MQTGLPVMGPRGSLSSEKLPDFAASHDFNPREKMGK